jgi:hypothetical protein
LDSTGIWQPEFAKNDLSVQLLDISNQEFQTWFILDSNELSLLLTVKDCCCHAFFDRFLIASTVSTSVSLAKT